MEKTDCEKKCAECNEELEATTAEYRAVAAIKLKDLMDYWAQYEEHQVELETLRRRNRVLEKVHDTEDPAKR